MCLLFAIFVKKSGFVMYHPQQWDVPTYWTCYLVLQNSIQILFIPSLFQHVFSEYPLYACHSITVLLTQDSKSSHQAFLFKSFGDAFRISGIGGSDSCVRHVPLFFTLNPMHPEVLRPITYCLHNHSMYIQGPG